MFFIRITGMGAGKIRKPKYIYYFIKGDKCSIVTLENLLKLYPKETIELAPKIHATAILTVVFL